MALVGTVYLPQQNHKLLSKSYHSDVNIYLYPGVFFLVSPLQIQGCLTCNNLSNTLKVVTNNGCSWQLPTWKRNLPKVNSLEEVGFLFHFSTIYIYYGINIADPSNMQDTYHMNFVIDLAHCEVSVARCQSIILKFARG